MNKQLEEVLQKKEIKPTAMRLLVLEFMLNSPVAVSLHDLEREFQYSDRTTLFRTLKTFEQQLLIHRINDVSVHGLLLHWSFLPLRKKHR